MNHEDQEHLKLLAIFHYVYGGLAALGGFVPLVWAGFVSVIIGSVAANAPNRTSAPPPELAGFFLCFGVGLSLVMWALAGCIICSGRCLAEQKHYLFSMIVAAVMCLNIPLGTVLGVFTIIVLSRPSVKALFEPNALSHDDRFQDENPYRSH